MSEATLLGQLDPAARLDLATDILGALARAAPRSVALLKGSLAEGRADAYSDIDISIERLAREVFTIRARLAQGGAV